MRLAKLKHRAIKSAYREIRPPLYNYLNSWFGKALMLPIIK
jgi:hypothetical protein